MKIFTLRKFKLFSQLFFTFLIPISGYCATITSKGTGGNWSEPSTWIGGVIPGSNDDVVIAVGTDVIINSVVNCTSLIIQQSQGNDASLTLSSSVAVLNVTGDVKINDGNLINLLAVGDGALNVGGDLIIYGNGQRTGSLTVNNGTVGIVGVLKFDGTNGQNAGAKIIAVTGYGAILSTTFINQNSGTITPGSEDNVFIRGNSYFKSSKSGDWETIANWSISKDNINFYLSPSYPNDNALGIEIAFPNTITLKKNTPVKNLIVNGTLDCNFKIIGAGPFTLNHNATLISADLNGITSSGLLGSIQVEGSRVYSPDANYIYKGDLEQSTGNGLPKTLNGILTINKNSLNQIITLSQPTLVTKLVDVKKGTFNSDGKLTLQSTASSYAQIGIIGIDAKVIKDVNVQSHFTGSPLSLINRGFRMISFPVFDNSTLTLYQQLRQKMVITGPNVGQTANYDVNKFDLGGTGQPYAVTLTTYSEPALALNSFVPVPTIKTLGIPGKATFVFFRGNRIDSTGKKVNLPYGFPEDVTANYKGTINQGEILVEITKGVNGLDLNNGINALGNPYPAAIDWDAIYTSNSGLVNNEIRLNKAGGGFITINSTGVVPETYSSTARYIQPGQGFYIQKTVPGSANFKFLETHKAVSSQASRILTLPSANLLANQFENGQQIRNMNKRAKNLRINIQKNDLTDETLIAFKEGFNSEIDNKDALYFAGNTVLVGSLSSDGKITSINAMPEVKDLDELKLYISASTSGLCKLNFTDISVADGYEIFLKDALFPDQVNNLKKQASYQFNIERSKSDTYGSNRFTVIFKREITKAPEVFTAEKIKSNVELEWSSQASKEIESFEVEISEDNTVFTMIGKVNSGNANGLTKYSFVHKFPFMGERFYRLKQVNINGSASYTEPRSIRFSTIDLNRAPILTVYPNPTMDTIHLNLGDNMGTVMASIINLEGKTVKNEKFTDGQRIVFQVSTLSKGVYILEIKNPDGKTTDHFKFIVGI